MPLDGGLDFGPEVTAGQEGVEDADPVKVKPVGVGREVLEEIGQGAGGGNAPKMLFPRGHEAPDFFIGLERVLEARADVATVDAGYGAIGRKNIAGDSENLFANAARLGAPRGTEVLEKGVGGVDTDYAEAGVLEVEDHIHGQGEGEHEKEDMEPAPASRSRHLVAGEHGGDEGKHRQHDKDDAGRMELGDGDTVGGDVDHGVEGRDELDGGVGGAGFLGGGNGLFPDA